MKKSEEKRIIQEDIRDLKLLISKYSKEKKFEKASECLKEMEKLQAELKGDNGENLAL